MLHVRFVGVSFTYMCVMGVSSMISKAYVICDAELAFLGSDCNHNIAKSRREENSLAESRSG